MKAQAIRGVCIGPEHHMMPGDVAELDDVTFQFLAAIGAVKRPEEAAEAPVTKPTTAPARAGNKE